MPFEAPHIDYAGISPVIALTAGLVVVLVGGLLAIGRAQRIVVSILGFGTLAAAAGLCIWQWGESKDLVAGALRLDDLALAVREHGQLLVADQVRRTCQELLDQPTRDRR